MPDPPLVVGPVVVVDQLVQLSDGVDLGDGDEVVAAEAADVALHPAFLLRPDAPSIGGGQLRRVRLDCYRLSEP